MNVINCLNEGNDPISNGCQLIRQSHNTETDFGCFSLFFSLPLAAKQSTLINFCRISTTRVPECIEFNVEIRPPKPGTKSAAAHTGDHKDQNGGALPESFLILNRAS